MINKEIYYLHRNRI